MSTTEADEDAPREEPDEPVEDDDDVEPSEGPVEPARRHVGFLLACIAAGVFAILAIVMVAIVVQDRSKDESGGDRTEISTTAARVAEAITAVDPSGNGTLTATVEQLGTSPVIAQYKEISDAMRKVMGPLKLQSIRGTVKEVYVGSIDGSEAKAIVRLDLVYVGDNTRVIPDQYLDMTLAKLDGVWKVDNVQVLNVALAGATPSTTLPGSQATTPSTASSSG